MRVIVAGGRDFNDYQFMCARLDHFFKDLDKSKLVIVNGDGPGLWDKVAKEYIAEGADQLAKRYADERGIKKVLYPADWNKYKRPNGPNPAGPIRNKQMAENADALVAFWDNRSRGTGGMIKLAEEHGLKIRVCPYKNISDM